MAGLYFEQFEPGQRFDHLVRRTVTETDNLLFSALNAKGDKSYPITCQTWVIVYAKQTDKMKADTLKAYLKFLVKDGQKLLSEIDYAPLPKSLEDKALKQLEKIQVK